MTISRLLSVLGLIVAVSADGSKDECGVPPPVNEDNLVTWLRDVFHVTRSPLDETNKKEVRRFITEQFGNISAAVEKAAVEVQRFSVSGQSPIEGVNIIYVLPGCEWGSERDNVLVVTANYDTTTSVTPDDNGSGMVALLETARILSSRAEHCTPGTTVIFVAVDQLPGEIGFTTFGTEYLIRKVLRKYNIPPRHFRGTVILKGLMNFDPAENSQHIPPAVYMLAPEPANAIAAKGCRGDFLAAVSLSSNGVGEVATLYHEHWATETAKLATSGRPLLYNFELSETLGLIEPFKENVEEFTHAGVFTFWTRLSNYTADNFNIVVLTDTVQMRGYMRRCHQKLCDNLEMALKPSNIELLRVTTTTLVRYLAEVSWRENVVTDPPSLADLCPVRGMPADVIQIHLHWLTCVLFAACLLT
ncbi:hypothetical protein NP493_53g05008 [Ridgeia piscesae]|uniref:Peptidase M28 domain-containing protein n=1 Tax=Ridgeia piscesae TaxID=27915 RepID=A0AAD9PAS0_RIDPI|nr:hypothetical protein NP493_53g05008 [Ridgeia piscesae]